MPGETHRTPLSSWSRDVARATVLAYRAGKGDGADEAECARRAAEAFFAAGGDAARVKVDLYPIISAAARDHTEWFWRPAHAYAERRDRYMRFIGMWPPTGNWSTWPKPPDDFV